ncbi:MAG TPA: MlaA family lipoprotein [Acetobacteraceae bacterium]|nr:MlaA family lipoprotein [Acetobacteraceae bacterium]
MLLPRLLLVASLIILSACATKPPPNDPDALAEYRETNDPLEPTNRFFYRINDGIDTYVLRPVAVAYREVVPGAARRSVHHLLTNMSSPVTFTDDMLQARPRRAGTTLMRFLINTTAGVGGLFDVATDLGYPEHDSDFGITLALWGVGEGPFLFLPILGPSNPRDLGGFGADIAIDPLTWASFGGSATLGWSRYGLSAIDTRERFLDTTDNIKKTALDPYATFRSLYRQNRQSTIEKARNDNETTVPAWFNR